MSLVTTIAGRSLRQRPARTIFSVLGIALGLTTVVGVFTLDHNTVLGLSLPGLAEWRPALEIRPARGVEDPRHDLAATPGVAEVSAFFQNDVLARAVRAPTRDRTISVRGGDDDASAASNSDEPLRARLFALDASSLENLDAVRLAHGRLLDRAADKRQVLVGEALAESLAIGPGDHVALSRPARAPSQACIDGEIRTLEADGSAREIPVEENFEVTGVLARENLGRRAQGQVVVVDYRWGRELYQGVHVEPVFWVRQDPAVDIERLRASLGTSYSYELNKSVIVGAAADERAFRNGVRMAGLLALVLGLYVIFHTLSMSLVERVREVATLHALGVTRAQVSRIFLCEALVIAGLAAAFGLAGGLAMARVLLRLGVTTLGTGHYIQVFEVPWRTVLALEGLGVGIALAGSIYPLLRASQANTVAALRGDDALRKTGVARGFHLFAAVLLVVLLPALYFAIVPVVGQAQGMLVGAILAGIGVLALLVVLPLLIPSLLAALSTRITRPFERWWPFAGRLAARSIRESPARIAVCAAAIALVTASFVGLKGMTASLRAEIEQWADRAIVDKVYVRGLPNVALQSMHDQLARYPGVLGIESGSARSYVPFLLLGLRARELARYGPCRQDPALLEMLQSGRGVILSQRLACHLGYALGDKVHVSNAAGLVQDLEVIAVSDAYGYFPHPDERLYGVVGDQFMRKSFCLDVDSLSEASIVLAPGTDPALVQTAIGELLPDARGVRYEAGRKLLVEHVDDLRRDFKLFDLILGLTALLAGLGVLNGQLLSALERVKELGVLKALGVTRRQIGGMVLCESLVVGLLGGVLGTALGAGLTPVIVKALEVLSGLDLPQVGAGEWLVWCPLGAIALSVLAALYPIGRMNRFDAVASVRTG